MRTSSTSRPTTRFSISLAEVSGWLTICFLLWLFLLAHDVLAATPTHPATTDMTTLAPTAITVAETTTVESAATTLLAEPPCLLFPKSSAFGRRSGVYRRTMAARRRCSQNHVDYWVAREANRHAQTTTTAPTKRHGVLALLFPRLRPSHRAAHRSFQSRAARRGPALGSIFSRNLGR